MKKVMVYAYTRFNLGDDLFIKVLCERYPQTTFVLYAPRNYQKVFHETNKNVHVISSDLFLVRGINFLFRLFGIHNLCRKLIASTCDGVVYVGGSLFMEIRYWEKSFRNTKEMKLKGKPFFLLGANFGPFQEADFFEKHKALFQTYTDICFRDQYSYDLFSDLKNVRKASDVVFQLPVNERGCGARCLVGDKRSVNEQGRQTERMVGDKRSFNEQGHQTERSVTDFSQSAVTKQRNLEFAANNVVISVIMPSQKQLKNKDTIYFERIKELSVYFIERDHTVTLMGFCEAEGDQEAIVAVKNMIPPSYLKSINEHLYQTNMNETLQIITNASFVIATRFHAMILGWLYEKPVFPIAYSNKMKHAMDDAGFTGTFADFNSLHTLAPNTVFESMKANAFDIAHQVKDAERHFDKLDEYLK
ncbi:polysaccharide pyruvyl transferase family protein [Virgibacillus sp. W0181]|uniref:polysaccharide pyruvyl transferase family protein n=1 Tax=Virgibacillus sp. W0181 TaxID=3391581 RepID=UPI003F45D95C